jgi:formylglycine-generating enzyme required for sulfatase activity
MLYRLPTEAEWEYAARAGSTTAYDFGTDACQLHEYGWYKVNAGGKTHPVGQLKPNAWGLYDMQGNVNVWEWVRDWYGPYPTGASIDPQGSQSGSARVRRGGSWSTGPESCRISKRDGIAPGRLLTSLGFRLLRGAL